MTRSENRIQGYVTPGVSSMREKFSYRTALEGILFVTEQLRLSKEMEPERTQLTPPEMKQNTFRCCSP